MGRRGRAYSSKMGVSTSELAAPQGPIRFSSVRGFRSGNTGHSTQRASVRCEHGISKSYGVPEKYVEAFARISLALDNLFRNEDTEFGDRLLTAGEMIRYEPSAVGFHPVSRERLQKKYLLKWWFDKGRADIRQFGLRPRARYFVRGVPLYMFRNLAAAFLRWVFTFDPGKRFHLKLKVFIKLGEMSECNRKSRIARTLTESNACT